MHGHAKHVSWQHVHTMGYLQGRGHLFLSIRYAICDLDHWYSLFKYSAGVFPRDSPFLMMSSSPHGFVYKATPIIPAFSQSEAWMQTWPPHMCKRSHDQSCWLHSYTLLHTGQTHNACRTDSTHINSAWLRLSCACNTSLLDTQPDAHVWSATHWRMSNTFHWSTRLYDTGVYSTVFFLVDLHIGHPPSTRTNPSVLP